MFMGLATGELKSLFQLLSAFCCAVLHSLLHGCVSSIGHQPVSPQWTPATSSTCMILPSSQVSYKVVCPLSQEFLPLPSVPEISTQLLHTFLTPRKPQSRLAIEVTCSRPHHAFREEEELKSFETLVGPLSDQSAESRLVPGLRLFGADKDAKPKVTVTYLRLTYRADRINPQNSKVSKERLEEPLSGTSTRCCSVSHSVLCRSVRRDGRDEMLMACPRTATRALSLSLTIQR